MDGQPCNPDAPVVDVSAFDAQDFCKWLSVNCALPNSELWWYCARTGKPERYWWGDDSSLLWEVSWNLANAGASIHEVKKKHPNPWGLYDVFGNVDEWTNPYEEETENENFAYGTAKVWRARALGGAYDMAIESFTQERVLQAQKPYD